MEGFPKSLALCPLNISVDPLGPDPTPQMDSVLLIPNQLDLAEENKIVFDQ